MAKSKKKKSPQKQASKRRINWVAVGALAAVAAAVIAILAFVGVGNEQPENPRLTKDEVKLAMERVFMDYGITISKLEGSTYSRFRDRLNEVGSRGFSSRGSIAEQLLNQEIKLSHDSLDIARLSFVREIEDLLLGSEFQTKDIHTIQILSDETDILDSLISETDNIKTNIRRKTLELRGISDE